MALLDLTADQLAQIIRALPKEEQKRLFELLTSERDGWWAGLRSGDGEHLRRIARSRGLDWDALNEEDKDSLIDDLMHGDA